MFESEDISMNPWFVGSLHDGILSYALPGCRAEQKKIGTVLQHPPLLLAPQCIQAKNGLSSFHMICIKVLSAAVIPLLLFGVLTTEVAARWRRKLPPRPDAQTFKN